MVDSTGWPILCGIFFTILIKALGMSFLSSCSGLMPKFFKLTLLVQLEMPFDIANSKEVNHKVRNDPFFGEDVIFGSPNKIDIC